MLIHAYKGHVALHCARTRTPHVRCSSSYLCTHLAEHLMRDAAFDEPLQVYEQWYADYFRAS